MAQMTAPAPNGQTMVAMSSEQLTAMLTSLQSSIMGSVQKLIDAGAVAASASVEKASAAKQEATAAAADQNKTEKRDYNPRFDPKQYARLNTFSGGDAAWKAWSFDFKVIALALNPSLTK